VPNRFVSKIVKHPVHSAMTQKKGECVKNDMHIVSTNFAEMLVWKHEYDFKLWRHKKRTPNTNDHHMPLNEDPNENFLPTPLQTSMKILIWKAEIGNSFRAFHQNLKQTQHKFPSRMWVRAYTTLSHQSIWKHHGVIMIRAHQPLYQWNWPSLQETDLFWGNTFRNTCSTSQQ